MRSLFICIIVAQAIFESAHGAPNESCSAAGIIAKALSGNPGPSQATTYSTPQLRSGRSEFGRPGEPLTIKENTLGTHYNITNSQGNVSSIPKKEFWNKFDADDLGLVPGAKVKFKLTEGSTIRTEGEVIACPGTVGKGSLCVKSLDGEIKITDLSRIDPMTIGVIPPTPERQLAVAGVHDGDFFVIVGPDGKESSVYQLSTSHGVNAMASLHHLEESTPSLELSSLNIPPGSTIQRIGNRDAAIIHEKSRNPNISFGGREVPSNSARVLAPEHHETLQRLSPGSVANFTTTEGKVVQNAEVINCTNGRGVVCYRLPDGTAKSISVTSIKRDSVSTLSPEYRTRSLASLDESFQNPAFRDLRRNPKAFAEQGEGVFFNSYVPGQPDVEGTIIGVSTSINTERQPIKVYWVLTKEGQIIRVFPSNGYIRIPTEGKPFDPEFLRRLNSLRN
ncbi:MAG: hypothetical protein IT289_03585 [Oligoflexia bacterium]|nr:hypothetical protein [Oligoflexia bacterium]